MATQEIKVTKEMFHRFLKVQQEGKHNMMSPQVRVLCKIDRAQHLYIMEHYDELEKQFGGIENVTRRKCN